MNDAEDVGATTPCGLRAAIDSARTPKATSPVHLWNLSIPNPRNQARSASSGGGADSDSDSISKEIDAEDVGAMTLCGLQAAMDSAHTPKATSPMQLWNPSIPKPKKSSNIFKFRRMS